ncbi:hypothetical protein SPBR_09151 [Sporothrix brasiliensis 5110]|uniref:Uncharacterized protein n=1 Tax=Sporothrix brasiliensis 5110 TaxID=1398154 RepID=A0A0C2F250_9PEZI|nr:uncharacterized protein SPBR_09151 [Sporothrix brasiliensis 5110]KIH93004.1 hypothetical protein SPBR_09151 [Sporothrix brasiliensis 5110]
MRRRRCGHYTVRTAGDTANTGPEPGCVGTGVAELAGPKSTTAKTCTDAAAKAFKRRLCLGPQLPHDLDQR